MNTFNSAINQPFNNYSSTLQKQFIATKQTRVHVMRLSVPLNRRHVWPLVKSLVLIRYLSDCVCLLLPHQST